MTELAIIIIIIIGSSSSSSSNGSTAPLLELGRFFSFLILGLLAHWISPSKDYLRAGQQTG
jgi:hypothetical protein